MKKTLTLIVWLLMPAAARAVNELSGFSPRPAGLGGAFTSIADDNSAAFYNPAGLRQAPRMEADFVYSRSLVSVRGLEMGSGWGAVSGSFGKWGSAGASWGQTYVADLYQEKTLTLTYAHGFATERNPWVKGTYLFGANYRRNLYGYTLDERTATDPVFLSGDDKAVSAYDFGVLYARGPQDNFRLGLSWLNFNRPDVGFRETEKLPRVTRVGLSYLYTGFTFIPVDFLPAFDAVFAGERREQALGVEARIRPGLVSLRAGGNVDGGRARDISFGLTYALPLKTGWEIGVDYVYIHPLLLADTTGSHSAGMRIKLK